MFLFIDIWGLNTHLLSLFAVISAALSYGFIGATIVGFSVYPIGYLILTLTDHSEYLTIKPFWAIIFGAILGFILGALSEYFRELRIESEKRKEIEKELVDTISEKELLVREVHHRVKNNLNIIKSLIEMQINRSEISEFKSEAKKLKNRIISISQIHEQLYSQKHISELDLEKYLPALVSNLIKTSSQISVKQNIDVCSGGCTVGLDMTTPLGLLINEVITNSLKYGIVNKEFPEISFDFDYIKDSNMFYMHISDNGDGFDISNMKSHGLGLKLINALSEQLGGKSSFFVKNGLHFELFFPAA